MLKIENFSFINRNRTYGRGGGVAAYVKNNIKFSILDFDLYPCNTSLEQLWLKVNIAGKDVAVGVIYRPPHGNTGEFFEMFENSLSVTIPMVDEVISAGDININLLIDNNETREFNNILDSYGLTQIIDQPTRISRTGVSLIDIFLTSDIETLLTTDVQDMHDVTDHCLIIAEFRYMLEKIPPKMITYRDFKNFNYQHFLNTLESIDFNEIFEIINLNDKINFLTSKIINVFDLHAPLRTVRVTKPKAEWLTDPLKIMIRERQKLLSKFKKSKSATDWQAYKHMRNYTTLSIREEKKAYIRYIHGTNDSKKLWSTLRSLNVTHKKKGYEIPNQLKSPENLNNHFLNCGNIQMKNNVDLKKFYSENTHHVIENKENFKFNTVTEEEIYKVINSLKSNAVGSDGISLRMIKLCVPYILPYIKHVINFSLTSSIFPHSWKAAVVHPIGKIPHPESNNDIRPISILPVLSKIAEKIIEHQIKNYIDQHKMFPVSQSGYRSRHSTTTALLKESDDIFTSWDNDEVTIFVMIDYSKAFDTVDHELLCLKLKYYGFSSDSVRFVKSYLSNRMQRTCVDNVLSSEKVINKGVAQGSILGPLFFIIYISDFDKVLNKCKMHNYADDTQLYISDNISNYNNMITSMNDELQQLTALSEDHHLRINPSKSVVMIFGPKKNRNELKNNSVITIEDQTLPIVETHKNLGLFLDDELRFKKHVSLLIKKAYNALRVLYVSRSLLSKNLKKKLCESLVLTQLNYCDVVYMSCLDRITANRLQKVQNSCVRFITGINRREHVSNRIKELSWLKVKDRFTLHYACLVHSVITHQQPQYLYNKLSQNLNIHNLNTRFNYKLRIPPHRTAVFQRSFSYTGVSVYNHVPDNIKHLSMPSFKNKLKKYLLAHG